MSHHLDSPEARADSRLDISDVYCFKGNVGTVLVINVDPLSSPNGFHPEAMYEFKLDLDGDALEDLTLRATFGAPDANGHQAVKLVRLTGKAASDRNAPGKVLTPTSARTEQIANCAEGVRLFCGRRGEPFYIAAPVITEVVRAMSTGTAVDLGTFDPGTATNLFGDSDVTSIVVELPYAFTGIRKIGFWGTTVLATDSGGWQQIQHAAGPLLDTIYDFATFSGVDYNSVETRRDKQTLGPQVLSQTTAVLQAMGTYDDKTGYGRPTADRYAQYVVNTILPDVLYYQVGTRANYGARTQNGKGLTESGPESMFELILNTHIEMGLDASDATGTPLTAFPYLADPIALSQSIAAA